MRKEKHWSNTITIYSATHPSIKLLDNEGIFYKQENKTLFFTLRVVNQTKILM